MTPILFPSNATTFTTHGLGDLTDATRCVVTHEINGEYELELDYPVTGDRYADIALRGIILAEPAQNEGAEPFRIYDVTQPMSGVVTVYARHLSYDMAGIPVSPYTAETPALACTGAVSAAETSCPFTVRTSKTGGAYALKEPRALWRVLGGQEGSLLDRYGGEWDFKGYVADLKTSLGSNRGVVIEYGKNLIDIEQESNIEGMYTGVYPYWSDGETVVTVPGKIVNIPGTFDHERVLVLDMSGDFGEKPSADDLASACDAYIAAHDMTHPVVSMDIEYAILSRYLGATAKEPVSLGDAVAVRFPRLGIDSTARVVKTVYDTILDRYDKVSIGNVKSNFAKIAVAQEKAIAEKPSADKVQAAINRATTAITGNAGGHIVIKYTDEKPEEILIMDTEDESTATRIWRWNLSGLGYSGDGGATYGLAMTAAGEIVADFITSGTLDANEVNVINLNAESINVRAGHSVAEELQELSDRIDGAKNHYEVTATPTLLNYPAWDFTYNIPCNGTVQLSDTLKWVYTAEYYKKHSGDLAFNSRTGLAYRFAFDADNGTFYWLDVADSDLGEILQRVYSLETTAEGLTSTAAQIRADLTTDETRITQNATGISAVASRTGVLETWKGTASTQITQTAEGLSVIATKVTGDDGLESKVAKAITDIEATSDGLSVIVGHVTGMDGTDAKLATAQADILANAAAIALKVSATDYTGETVVSLINLSPTTAKIRAQHLDLEGAVTITALDSATRAKVNGATSGTVPVYYRSSVLQTPTISASTTITTGADTTDVWTYNMPRPARGTYFYECNRLTKSDGSVSFSAVRQVPNANYTSRWCSANDAAYIDGGAIYANSVTAAQIAAGTITISKLDTSTSGKINAAGTRTITLYYRSTTDTTPTISSSSPIGDTVNTDNQWSFNLPAPKKGRTFFCCTRTARNDGAYDFSAVRKVSNSDYVSRWCASADATYIDGGAIYANSVTANQIAAGAITAGKIAAGAISADKIAAGAISASKVDSTIITTANFSAQSISASQITSGTISTSRLSSDVITTANFSAQSINADKITSGTISTSRLSSDVITTTNFSAQSISASQITSGTISADRIDAAMIGAKIAVLDAVDLKFLSVAQLQVTEDAYLQGPVMALSSLWTSGTLNVDGNLYLNSKLYSNDVDWAMGVGGSHRPKWVDISRYSTWAAFRNANPYILAGYDA